jgi:hypothetical protein
MRTINMSVALLVMALLLISLMPAGCSKYKIRRKGIKLFSAYAQPTPDQFSL